MVASAVEKQPSADAQHPALVVNSYLSASLRPGLVEAEFREQSLYNYLERNCNVFIVRAQRKIEALAANEKEAGLPELEVGDPLILLDSVSHAADDMPIESYRAAQEFMQVTGIALLRRRKPDYKKSISLVCWR